MEAVIYIAHGSRRDSANAKFVEFIEKAMGRSKTNIQEYAFLEHAEPSLFHAIESAVQQGARKITVVPVFLLPGVHANQDVPELIERARKLNPEISFFYGEPLGCDERMVAILSDRLVRGGFSGTDGEAVLLVGHGSREPAAAVEFEKLAATLRLKLQKEVPTAFITTPPYYENAVSELLASGVQKIYLLPFLLFSGGFTRKMENNLEPIAKQVQMCEPIGFDEKLIPLLEKRAKAAVLF